SSKHGLYTKPNNTAEDGEKIGLGSLYANQNVQIIQSAKLSTGVTAYQFQINGVHIIGYAKTSRTELLHFTVGGKDAGWMDKRAFTTTLDKATYSKTSRKAKIGDVAASSKHGLYTKPNNTAEDGDNPLNYQQVLRLINFK
ncbi:GW dipeptide domain-containing protein, partial [Enterococcus faecalis]|uniref:GW dipeptide domain-containing protein n=1 Tax=Enterococcus faecalis TaxID=1351 RepID=UPI0022E00956